MITRYNPSLSSRLIKFTLLSGVGVLATFSIFVVMSKLATIQGSKAIEQKPPVIVELGAVKDDSNTQKIVKKLPEPPVQPKPPQRAVEPQVSDDTNLLAGLLTPNVTGPSLDLTPTLNLGVQDSGARPMFQIQPKYPIKAARDGIEGWVSMSFSIDPLGQVYDIKVIDAKPKRVFDQAARKALKRWRYQPKVVDGSAVEQHGQSVLLEFNLSES